MFFILSKLLVVFLYPLTWITAAMALSMFLRNKKLRHRCLCTAFVLLVIFTNPFLIGLLAKKWDVQKKPLIKSKYSCAILLGGFASHDIKEVGYFNQAADRFIQTALLKTTGRIDHVLLTGGNADIIPGKFRESSWSAEQLQQLNIDSNNILIENQSRNTFENAQLSAKLLRQRKLPPPYLLVTSAFHMRRSMLVFEKAGLEVEPYPSNYLIVENSASLGEFFPKPEVLTLWNIYIKEMVGFLAYKIKP